MLLKYSGMTIFTDKPEQNIDQVGERRRCVQYDSDIRWQMEKQPPGPHPDDTPLLWLRARDGKLNKKTVSSGTQRRNTQAPQAKYQTQKVNTTHTWHEEMRTDGCWDGSVTPKQGALQTPQTKRVMENKNKWGLSQVNDTQLRCLRNDTFHN